MMVASFAKYLHGFSSRSPRWSAALWFGCWGFLGAAAMFLVPSMARGTITLGLYVILPTLASGIAGYISGAQILDPRRMASSGKAFGIGVLVALEAVIFLAPLFAITYTLSKLNGDSNILGLAFGVLTSGFLATAPVVLPLGGLSGLVLHTLRRRIEKFAR